MPLFRSVAVFKEGCSGSTEIFSDHDMKPAVEQIATVQSARRRFGPI